MPPLSALFPSSSFVSASTSAAPSHLHLCHHRQPHHCSTFLFLILSKTIWASNTGLAATLLSPSSSSKSAKFLYIKPVQTGFLSDSDFRKLSQLVLRRRPSFAVSASNHVLKTSASASEAVLGYGSEGEDELRDLGAYEERRLLGKEMAAGAASELICNFFFFGLKSTFC